MPSSAPTIAELMADCTRSAVHLELRDHYGTPEEAEDFDTWLRTGQLDTDPRSPDWAPWVDLVSETVARGVTVRRARVISEPASDYIRYEHASTIVNLRAGELVRWLPRHLASGIALPDNDFWLFDEQVIRWGYFDSNGGRVGHGISEDVADAKLCAEAFEAVWSLAIPHDQYEIH